MQIEIESTKRREMLFTIVSFLSDHELWKLSRFSSTTTTTTTAERQGRKPDASSQSVAWTYVGELISRFPDHSQAITTPCSFFGYCLRRSSFDAELERCDPREYLWQTPTIFLSVIDMFPFPQPPKLISHY